MNTTAFQEKRGGTPCNFLPYPIGREERGGKKREKSPAELNPYRLRREKKERKV